MKKLAFIFGLPRGGTTLVWALLNDCENTFAIRKDRNTSESAIYVNKKNPKKIIENCLEQNSDKLVFEKTPIHTLHHKRICSDFPNSFKIIIDRFPLATANSLKKVTWAEYNNERIVKDIKEYYQNINEIRNYYNSFNIRFKDIIENFETTVGGLFDFLGIDYTEFDFISKKRILHKDILPNKNAFRIGKVHSWKTELSHYDISYFRENLENEISTHNKFWKK